MLFDYLKEAVLGERTEVILDQRPKNDATILTPICICRREAPAGAPVDGVFVRAVFRETHDKYHVVTIHDAPVVPLPGVKPTSHAPIVDQYTSLKIWKTNDFFNDVYAYWGPAKHKSLNSPDFDIDKDRVWQIAEDVVRKFTEIVFDDERAATAVLKSSDGAEWREVTQISVDLADIGYNETRVSVTDKGFSNDELRSRKISWASRLEYECAEWNTNILCSVRIGYLG